MMTFNSMAIYRNGGQGWRDGSIDKSTCCSSKGLRFGSQHPYGSSQLSVMSGLENLMASLDSVGTRHAYTVYLHACRQNTHTRKIII